jgi:uncharacterized membrane protein
MKAKLLMIAITIVSIGYPIIVFFGLKHFSPAVVASVLLLMVLARLSLVNTQSAPWVKTSLLMVSLLLLTSALTNSQALIRFYPVVINITLLVIFALSLTRPPSVVETLARLTEPDLPPSGVVYTKKVTQAWCVFFVFNAAIATYTARFMSLENWTLYNGFIAYILMGLFFTVEWLIRRRVKAKNAAQDSNH